MIDWNGIQILESRGLTFWRLQKNPNKPEMNTPWSRDIKDLINNIKELECSQNKEKMQHRKKDDKYFKKLKELSKDKVSK